MRRPYRSRRPSDPKPAPNPYSPAQQLKICAIARGAVVSALWRRGVEPVDLVEEMASLNDRRGCFVTLRNKGRLRGCIGTFEADAPLWKNVQKMAAAATRDPRFVDTDPVQVSELDDLNIEVSVLTPPKPIRDPLRMRIGVDGILIKTRSGSGCFLPDVAVDQKWDAAQTLSACCHGKMGLSADAWREPAGMEFFIFQSIKIQESDA